MRKYDHSSLDPAEEMVGLRTFSAFTDDEVFVGVVGGVWTSVQCIWSNVMAKLSEASIVTKSQSRNAQGTAGMVDVGVAKFKSRIRS